MRWLLAVTAIGATVIAAGCGTPGEPTPADTPAPVVTSTSDTAAETSTTDAPPPTTKPAQTATPPKRTTAGKPGVPGSPIDYDSTLSQADPANAKSDIEESLTEACGPGHCGVTVVITGQGNCSPKIYPDPVLPGGVITIVAGPCPGEETTETTGPTETTDG